ncbi:MAG: hypothetical protein ABIL23_07020 [candidate division WOR-3 bacterium]
MYNGGGSSGSQVIRIRPGSQNILIENTILGLRANGVPSDSKYMWDFLGHTG